MTFSIVAIDRENNQTGFAIASCCWDAGQVCMARPSGAIASQAQGNITFLRDFFQKVDEGMIPEQIMQHFVGMDPEIETRQVGMITFQGEKVAFTGGKCSFWAGHRTGDDYSCQGNILVGPEVIDSMAEAFEGSDGPLHERMFLALEAADAAGGDARGRQSARLFVSQEGREQPFIDIRIEDSDSPITEMAAILKTRRNLVEILDYMNRLPDAPDSEKEIILQGLRGFLEDKRQVRYLDWWEFLADSYLQIGRNDLALEAYSVYFDINPGMRRIFSENARAGNFPEDMAIQLGLL